MATPSKNFVDPTRLSTFGPRLAQTEQAPPRFVPLLAWIPAPRDTRLVMVCIPASPEIQNPHSPKLPDPPFGRQLVMTFPAIYRDRPSGNKNAFGQLWPWRNL